VDRYTALVIIASIIGTTILLGTVAQAVIKAMELRRQKIPLNQSTARIEEQLSRLEQAVDAVAVEVERISESQRFATKLLADRTAERI
jgi:hypothetical protein